MSVPPPLGDANAPQRREPWTRPGAWPSAEAATWVSCPAPLLPPAPALSRWGLTKVTLLPGPALHWFQPPCVVQGTDGLRSGDLSAQAEGSPTCPCPGMFLALRHPTPPRTPAWVLDARVALPVPQAPGFAQRHRTAQSLLLPHTSGDRDGPDSQG